MCIRDRVTYANCYPKTCVLFKPIDPHPAGKFRPPPGHHTGILKPVLGHTFNSKLKIYTLKRYSNITQLAWNSSRRQMKKYSVCFSRAKYAKVHLNSSEALLDKLQKLVCFLKRLTKIPASSKNIKQGCKTINNGLFIATKAASIPLTDTRSGTSPYLKYLSPP